MTEMTKEELLGKLHAEFKAVVEEHQFMEVDPPQVVARFVFYAAIMYSLGLGDNMDYWVQMGKNADVSLITKEEAKKFIN
jgi:hypothetical protein